MDVSFEDDIAYTCSKDGQIFKSSLIEQHKFSKIHQLDAKLMINTLAVDYKHQKLWLGTPDSQATVCLDLAV